MASAAASSSSPRGAGGGAGAGVGGGTRGGGGGGTGRGRVDSVASSSRHHVEMRGHHIRHPHVDVTCIGTDNSGKFTVSTAHAPPSHLVHIYLTQVTGATALFPAVCAARSPAR